VYRFSSRSFGLNLFSPYTLILGVAGIFLVIEWLEKQNLLPEVKLPGFNLDPACTFMFLGFIAFSALISLRTAAYFLTIAWIAEFCKANQQYPLLKTIADTLYAPQAWVVSKFQNTFIPAEHLGIFLTFLIYLAIAYILAKEQQQKVKIVMEPPKMRG